MLLVGGHMVANGSLSLADFVAFNLFLAMLSCRCGCSGCGSARAQRATASGERIFQVIDEPEEIRDAPERARAAAGRRAASRFEGVTFGYDPTRPVLRRASTSSSSPAGSSR